MATMAGSPTSSGSQSFGSSSAYFADHKQGAVQLGHKMTPKWDQVLAARGQATETLCQFQKSIFYSKPFQANEEWWFLPPPLREGKTDNDNDLLVLVRALSRTHLQISELKVQESLTLPKAHGILILQQIREKGKLILPFYVNSE